MVASNYMLDATTKIFNYYLKRQAIKMAYRRRYSC